MGFAETIMHSPFSKDWEYLKEHQLEQVGGESKSACKKDLHPSVFLLIVHVQLAVEEPPPNGEENPQRPRNDQKLKGLRPELHCGCYFSTHSAA